MNKFKAERISQSIFYNNWYDSEVNIKMYVQFVIMNTQRTIAFSAGGIADISRETITFVSWISSNINLSYNNWNFSDF